MCVLFLFIILVTINRKIWELHYINHIKRLDTFFFIDVGMWITKSHIEFGVASNRV